jgi:hypothetical protein
LLATGPLVGLTWIAAAAVNALPPWRHQLPGPLIALPLAGPAGLTVSAQLQAFAASTRVVDRHAPAATLAAQGHCPPPTRATGSGMTGEPADSRRRDGV